MEVFAPLWFIILDTVGTICGALLLYYGWKRAKDDTDRVPLLMVCTFILGFCLMGWMGIFGLLSS